jgi:hypothetical protein
MDHDGTVKELLAVAGDLPTGPLATRPSATPGDAATSAGAGRDVLAVASLRQIRRTGERGPALAATALALATVGPLLAVLFVLL